MVGRPLHPGRLARFAKVKVGAVTTKMAQDFMGEVGAARAPNTARRIFGVLSDVTQLAAQRGYIAASPCAAVELASMKRAGVRRSHLYLEGPELLALADGMPAHWRLPVLVAGSSGLRAGELWALRRRDVDFLHKELTVRYALKEINSSAASLAENKGLARRPAEGGRESPPRVDPSRVGPAAGGAPVKPRPGLPLRLRDRASCQ